ncbi:MAG: extracellular solute-binding protein, partial [Deltaproteobacteria bacterium]|nr:extracellular solute-binding protein [Deltaproteobacteria bacterium]
MASKCEGFGVSLAKARRREVRNCQALTFAALHLGESIFPSYHYAEPNQRRQLKMTSLIAAVMVLSASAIGWCQSARPSTAIDLAKYAGADRERLLYDGAKKEGKLVWYTSLSTYKEVAKVFEAKYPGVAVEFYRASGTTLATRILSESSARRYLADAVETTPGAIMLLRDNKLLLPYASPHLADYPDGSKEKAPGGLVYATVDRESYPGIGYNRSAIREADVPKNFDDLLKPALKGKMGISGEEIGASVIGAILKAKGDGFVKKLAAQEIKLYSLPALGLNELVASGEVPLT